MRICPVCAAVLPDGEWRCKDCQWTPVLLDGFPLLAPDIASDNPDYPAQAHAQRVHLEATSFWFLNRNRLITHVFGRFFPEAASLLEIGCGTGFVLAGISQAFPMIRLFGADAYPSGLKYAKERISGAEFAQMNVYRLPFTEEFDVVGSFDVLEHLTDDRAALREMHKTLKHSGGVILVVPQHPGLWSVVDEKAGHKRRYTRVELRDKVQSAGFEILYMTSFISFLLPLMLFSRWKKSKQHDISGGEIRNELAQSQALNTLFRYVCTVERFFLQGGFSFPAGGSLLCVGRKRDGED